VQKHSGLKGSIYNNPFYLNYAYNGFAGLQTVMCHCRLPMTELLRKDAHGLSTSGTGVWLTPARRLSQKTLVTGKTYCVSPANLLCVLPVEFLEHILAANTIRFFVRTCSHPRNNLRENLVFFRCRSIADLKVQYATIILFKLYNGFTGLQTSIMCHCRCRPTSSYAVVAHTCASLLYRCG
jgi:hypothetical protein